jgi:hypothetical protein
VRSHIKALLISQTNDNNNETQPTNKNTLKEWISQLPEAFSSQIFNLALSLVEEERRENNVSTIQCGFRLFEEVTVIQK